jgi:hypothetical protein
MCELERVPVGHFVGSEREDNIKMDLREIGLEGLDRIHLAQDMDRWLVLVNTVMNRQVP